MLELQGLDVSRGEERGLPPQLFGFCCGELHGSVGAGGGRGDAGHLVHLCQLQAPAHSYRSFCLDFFLGVRSRQLQNCPILPRARPEAYNTPRGGTTQRG